MNHLIHRVLLVSALLFGAGSLARAQESIYIPSPLTGEHQTALQRAAEALAADFLEATGSTKTIVSYDRSNVPTPGSGFVVTIGQTADLTGVNSNGYAMEGGPRTFRVHAHDMDGAVDGLHGLRLEFMKDDHQRSVLSRDEVNPAFDKRGFMVILAPHELTAPQLIELVDSHRLYGANTLTIITSLFMDDTLEADPLEADVLAVKALMEHCQDIGVRFQVGISATGIQPDFYWQHYQAERAWYDPDHVNHIVDTAEVDAAGADFAHQIGGGPPGGEQHKHFKVYYGTAASLEKLEGNVAPDPVPTDLEATQEAFYEVFKETDAFLIVLTEGAENFSDRIVDGPTGVEWVSENFEWISDQIDAIGSDAELVYWGWLHDVWLRSRLQDYDYGEYAGPMDKNNHPALQDFAEDSYEEVRDQLQAHDPNQPLEWVQEVGYFYATIEIWLNMHAALTAIPITIPTQLIDPLGALDDAAFITPGTFEKTAFLYWNHYEPDPRNYFPRPAIRTSIADMRAALRLNTKSLWGGTSGPASTGIMGYRFLGALRRPLNDYVVLRCASDEDFLVPTSSTMDDAALTAAQGAVIDDLTAFLGRGGSTTDLQAVHDSLTDLDDSRPAVSVGGLYLPDIDNTKLYAALDVFDTQSVDWWDLSPELQDYYLMLAFTVYIEKAGEFDPDDTEFKDFVDMAARVARESRPLELFAHGSRALQEALIGRVADGLEATNTL